MTTLICQALVHLMAPGLARRTLTMAHKKTGPGKPGPENKV